MPSIVPSLSIFWIVSFPSFFSYRQSFRIFFSTLFIMFHLYNSVQIFTLFMLKLPLVTICCFDFLKQNKLQSATRNLKVAIPIREAVSQCLNAITGLLSPYPFGPMLTWAVLTLRAYPRCSSITTLSTHLCKNATHNQRARDRVYARDRKMWVWSEYLHYTRLILPLENNAVQKSTYKLS